MEFFSDFGLFLAKVVTLVVAAMVVFSVVAQAAQRSRSEEDSGAIRITRYNERLRQMREQVEGAMLPRGRRKRWIKDLRKRRKAEKKESRTAEGEDERSRLFVIDFNGDIKASDTRSLRRCVSAILAVADPERDQVAVRLESAGGLVHSYGLASAQLDRIRQAGLSLTACVDKVAASGGYMMACVADRIVASPFALVGSIGVVAQIPNFHRFLKRHDVDFEVLTAGEHKRTLTVFGENTQKGRQKFLHDLDDTHDLFKRYVAEHRPSVDIDEVANGDVWFGQRALEVGLVDALTTSDQFLIEACDERDVFVVRYEQAKTLPEKLGMAASTVTESVVVKLAGLARQNRFQ